MAKTLTDTDVLRIIKEEWEKLISEVDGELDVLFKPKKGTSEIDVISPELKVMHKKSGFRYTVDATSTNTVTLRTPEGDHLDVTHDEFENDYQLD